MKPAEEKQQTRTRGYLLTLLGMSIFSLTMFVFGYIQNIEAKRQRELSIHLKEELIGMEKIAEQHQKEAMMQRVLAEEREKMAQKALEECKQNQKK